MTQYPSIYSAVVFDLHPKVKSFLDQLNAQGQIDLDHGGYPYLVKCDRNGNNYVTYISRNNSLVNFVLNPRKQASPVISWDVNDGFQRPQQKQVVVMQQEPDSNVSRERTKVRFETIEHIIEAILK